MTEVIHGLVSGMIWSETLGTCLIAIAAVVTATVPASAGAKDSRGNDSRPGRIADHGDGVHGPSRDNSTQQNVAHGLHSATVGQKFTKRPPTTPLPATRITTITFFKRMKTSIIHHRQSRWYEEGPLT